MTTSFEPGAPTPDGIIPLCVPEIRGNAWKYVKECLDLNWISSVGPFVDRFETMVSTYIGTKYAVATVNGTAALHIALMVAGVESGDEVLVSDLTFVAPANAVRYVGAWPVFIDAEPDFWQMDPQKVSDFLEKECVWTNGSLTNRSTGRRVKAIIPVHILGHPVDMDAILQTARKYGLVVIEDATESLGGDYKGRRVGHLGDIACFSFNGNKIISTGGGGMIVTDNEAWARKARYLTTQAKDDPVEFVHNEIGYNYRLSNMQAALGCSQMELLDEYVGIKRRIADQYISEFKKLEAVKPMREAPWASSIFWMFTVLISQDSQKDSRKLLKYLESAGIQTRPLWRPMHMLPAHESAQAYKIQYAEKLYWQSLSLPSSVGLLDAELNQVIEVIKNFFAEI